MEPKGSIVEQMRQWFVSKEVFELEMKAVIARIVPLERIGYGAVTMIVTAVFGALIATVVITRR